MKTCKVWNGNLVEDVYHLHLKCLVYNVIRENYDDLLRGRDSVSVILKFPAGNLGEHMCEIYFDIHTYSLLKYLCQFHNYDHCTA